MAKNVPDRTLTTCGPQDCGSCDLNLSIFVGEFPRLGYDKDTAKSPESSDRQKVRAVVRDTGRNDRPWRDDRPDSTVSFRAGVRWELYRIEQFKNVTLVRMLANRICLNIEWLQTGP